MTLSERAARIRALSENLTTIDRRSPEGVLLAEMIALFSEMAEIVERNDEDLDEMSEILADIESELEGEFDEDDDSYDEEEDVYDVTCPGCDRSIEVDYDMLDKGLVICPNCGERIEFVPPQ